MVRRTSVLERVQPVLLKIIGSALPAIREERGLGLRKLLDWYGLVSGRLYMIVSFLRVGLLLRLRKEGEEGRERGSIGRS